MCRHFGTLCVRTGSELLLLCIPSAVDWNIVRGMDHKFSNRPRNYGSIETRRYGSANFKNFSSLSASLSSRSCKFINKLSVWLIQKSQSIKVEALMCLIVCPWFHDQIKTSIFNLITLTLFDTCLKQHFSIKFVRRWNY